MTESFYRTKEKKCEPEWFSLLVIEEPKKEKYEEGDEVIVNGNKYRILLIADGNFYGEFIEKISKKTFCMRILKLLKWGDLSERMHIESLYKSPKKTKELFQNKETVKKAIDKYIIKGRKTSTKASHEILGRDLTDKEKEQLKYELDVLGRIEKRAEEVIEFRQKNKEIFEYSLADYSKLESKEEKKKKLKEIENCFNYSWRLFQETINLSKEESRVIDEFCKKLKSMKEREPYREKKEKKEKEESRSNTKKRKAERMENCKDLSEEKEIKYLYRELSKIFHPDRAGGLIIHKILNRNLTEKEMNSLEKELNDLKNASENIMKQIISNKDNIYFLRKYYDNQDSLLEQGGKFLIEKLKEIRTRELAETLGIVKKDDNHDDRLSLNAECLIYLEAKNNSGNLNDEDLELFGLIKERTESQKN